MSQKSKFGGAGLPFLMAFVSIVSILVGMRLNESLITDGYFQEKKSDEYNAIYEASEHIKSKYYGDLNKTKFADAVIIEMIEQLDPHSRYFRKEQNALYERYLDGIYRGVGIQFKASQDSIFVFTVFQNSPAERAGIKKGDILLKLDEIDLVNYRLSIDSLLLLTKKNIGDEIILETFNLQSGNSQSYKLVVEDVEIPMIKDFLIKHSTDSTQTSYIKIKRFYKNIFRDFMKALEEHATQSGPVKNLILDLRNNPGGIVDESVKILNQLVNEKDFLLLSTKNKHDNSKDYFSNGRSFLKIERIVIICNEASASASEIMAGVLQDYDKAVIIGQNTYGKGLIQQNFDLANNASINLSIGEYILPSGRSIYNSSIDTTEIFYTLSNNRKLENVKGINVDKQLSICNIDNGNENLISDVIFKNKLWSSPLSKEKMGEIILSLNIETNDQGCSDEFRNNLKWEICQVICENGTYIDYSNLDMAVQSAFELLYSEEYNDLLNNHVKSL